LQVWERMKALGQSRRGCIEADVDDRVSILQAVHDEVLQKDLDIAPGIHFPDDVVPGFKISQKMIEVRNPRRDFFGDGCGLRIRTSCHRFRI